MQKRDRNTQIQAETVVPPETQVHISFNAWFYTILRERVLLFNLLLVVEVTLSL